MLYLHYKNTYPVVTKEKQKKENDTTLTQSQIHTKVKSYQDGLPNLVNEFFSREVLHLTGHTLSLLLKFLADESGVRKWKIRRRG